MGKGNLRASIIFLLSIVATRAYGNPAADFESMARPLMEASVVLISNLLFFLALLTFVSMSANKAKSELKRARENADIDPLTKVWNRRGLDRELDDYTTTNGFYFIIDIDDFKLINDTYGHGVGDDVLKHVAAILKTRLRESDLIGRFGGEEFVIYLPRADKQLAKKIAGRLVNAVDEAPFVTAEGVAVCATISLGGYEKEPSQTSFSSAFSEADKQLYKAKNQGKNQAIIQGAA